MELVHVPVMPREILEYCVPVDEDGLLIDATLGEGGHSATLLAAYPHLKMVGIDADPAMIDRAQSRLAQFEGRTTLVQGWFDDYFANYPSDEKADVVLFDLGISMFHLRKAERGFAYSDEASLDMRLAASGGGPSASDLVNSLPENELADLIYRYGEERYSRRIAAAIVAARPVRTARDLAEAVFTSVPVSYRHGRIHPATRTFQAIRIAVNDELGRIERALPAAALRLKPGGTLAVISFHSLEDRIAKNTFRALADPDRYGEYAPAATLPMMKAGGYRLETKKPLFPTEEEATRNPASRSARLRVLRRVAGEAA